MCKAYADFNSIKVQLEQDDAELLYNHEYHFNSIKVQLELLNEYEQAAKN